MKILESPRSFSPHTKNTKRGPSSIETFCEAVKRVKTRRVIEVEIAKVIVSFTVIQSDTMLILHTTVSDGCFELVIHKAKAYESELKNLLLPAKRDCPNLPSGGALLAFADQINECFEVKMCRLTNAATFEVGGTDYDADCLYARDHHGLGFYMSRGYLIRKSTLEKSVFKSNQTIEAWNDFWNQGRFDTSVKPECGFQPSGREMVKYYDAGVKIYIPRNKFAPALVYIDGTLDDKRLERLEDFDYRQGWESLKLYKRAVKNGNEDVETLFALLRAAYPAPSDDAIRERMRADLSVPWNR